MPREELPPRARRIRGVSAEGEVCLGTTSACAENTGAPPISVRAVRNYLRVRGEYSNLVEEAEGLLELPPRARRILNGKVSLVHVFGTTSACAENTAKKIVLDR